MKTILAFIVIILAPSCTIGYGPNGATATLDAKGAIVAGEYAYSTYKKHHSHADK